MVPALAKAGLEVLVETDAGARAGFGDEGYVTQGARIVGSRSEALACELLLQVRCAGADPEGSAADLAALRSGQTVVVLASP